MLCTDCNAKEKRVFFCTIFTSGSFDLFGVRQEEFTITSVELEHVDGPSAVSTVGT